MFYQEGMHNGRLEEAAVFLDFAILQNSPRAKLTHLQHKGLEYPQTGMTSKKQMFENAVSRVKFIPGSSQSKQGIKKTPLQIVKTKLSAYR